MERCDSCDKPTAVRVTCANAPSCTMEVGPCCLTRDSTCVDCGDEFAAAAQHKEREDREEQTRMALILSGSCIGGLQMPLISKGGRC